VGWCSEPWSRGERKQPAVDVLVRSRARRRAEPALAGRRQSSFKASRHPQRGRQAVFEDPEGARVAGCSREVAVAGDPPTCWRSPASGSGAHDPGDRIKTRLLPRRVRSRGFDQIREDGRLSMSCVHSTGLRTGQRQCACPRAVPGLSAGSTFVRVVNTADSRQGESSGGAGAGGADTWTRHGGSIAG